MDKKIGWTGILIALAMAACLLLPAASYEVGHEKHAYIGAVQFDHSKIRQAPMSLDEAIRQATAGDGMFNISHKNNSTMLIFDTMELARYPIPWTTTTAQDAVYWSPGITQDWAPTKRLNLQKQVYGG